MNLKKFFLISLFLSFLLTIFLSCNSQQKTKEKIISEPKEAVMDVMNKSADFKISAIKLYKEYKANEPAADNKYNGKIIEVSGKIERIGKDILGQAYVTLKIEDYSLASVQCVFPDVQKSTVASLSQGQQIVIKGECKGKLLGTVLLEKCVVIQ